MQPFMANEQLVSVQYCIGDCRDFRGENTQCIYWFVEQGKVAPTMVHYSEDEMSEYQDAFSLFDKKGDGMIGCDQVGEVLRALGLNPLTSEINRLLKEIDPDGMNEKRLSFEEFLPIYHEQRDKQPSSTLEAFIEAFRIFDLDNNGLISGGEIRHLLTMLGEKMSMEEVDVLLQGLEDVSGKVHYEEFVKNVMNN